MWAWNSIEKVWQDARYAQRAMRRNPGFTAVAIFSLSLGIGANIAIFSLIDTLMLRLLPVRAPGQLVELLQKYPGEPRGNGYWSPQSYEYFRDHNHVFSALIATTVQARVPVRVERLDPETLNGEYVADDFFSSLGVQSAIGRLLGAEDSRMSSEATAVVSWTYWKNRFNLDPAILGRRLMVQDQPVTIVGVTSRAFFGLLAGSPTDVWLPRRTGFAAPLTLLGRLKPDVSIQQARAEMALLFRFTVEERSRSSQDPLMRQLKIEVEPAGVGLSLLRDRFARPLLVLMALTGLLLLIACTNVASLLLARGAARRKEMAVRVSLGAGRFRLIQLVLTEALLLSGLGTVLGVFLAYFGTGALMGILLSGRRIIGLPPSLNISFEPDPHMLLFAAAAALFTGVLFGMAPAWHAFASAPVSSLREMGRAGETRFRRIFGQGLVAAQVALSVALLSSAALFVRNLSNLEHLDLGFRRDHVLLVTLDPSRGSYSEERLSQAFHDLSDRLEALPGVRSVSLTAPTPLSGAGASGFASVEGFEERPENRSYISIGWVAPKYFETIGTPFITGRDFDLRDDGRAAIVNQALARYYFPGGNPVGKQVTLEHVTGGGEPRHYEVVGVVADANYYDIREAKPRTIYLPAFQGARVLARTFVVRTAVDPMSLAGDVRRTVGSVLKTVPVSRIATISDQVDATIVTERLIAMLSSSFGALGSLLAAVGLYGLLAYTVVRRTTEIGIRMALGASRVDVVRMVLGNAVGMVTVGLVFGIPMALAGQRIAGGLMQDLPAPSAAPIAFGALGMIAAALIAGYLPARRAARVEPMEALRHE